MSRNHLRINPFSKDSLLYIYSGWSPFQLGNYLDFPLGITFPVHIALYKVA